jgi:integrase
VNLEPEILPPEILPPPAAALAPTAAGETGLAVLAPGHPLYETARATIEYMEAAKAASTRRAYDSDWRHFDQWCVRHGLPSLPATPATVALYISELAKGGGEEKPRKPATISRRLTAINNAHKERDLDSPATMNHRVVADSYHGIRRTVGTAQVRKKPLTRERIVRILNTLEGPIAAARSKALLLIGFAGALRRSELAAMRVEDLAWQRKGITIKLPRSKTDQEAAGREVDILWGVSDQTCPVLALENWLKIARVKDGPVFRSVGQYGKVGGGLHPNSIGRLVKDLVRKAKIANPDMYGGHSLRAGYVTEASSNGADDRDIMKQTGHTSIAMVHRYSRADQRSRQAATSKLGL